MNLKISRGRRIVVVALLGTATLATGAASAVGAATDSGVAAPHHVVRRIHLVERELTTDFVDLGAAGESVGDRATITSEILSRNGTPVGRADFDCVETALGTRSGVICSGVVTLPGGQITGTFFEPLTGAEPDRDLQAITGGTGDYEGAHGQFIVGQETTAGTPVVVELVS